MLPDPPPIHVRPATESILGAGREHDSRRPCRLRADEDFIISVEIRNWLISGLNLPD
jgi:hypothetical protein